MARKDNNEGNWWGHTPPEQLFTEGVDSNMVGVIDTFPYPQKDGWLMTCTVTTDGNGYATCWLFKLGTIKKVTHTRRRNPPNN